MSSALSQQVFQDNVIQHGVSQQPLELGILIFQSFQPRGLGNLHAAILGLQFVERRRAQAVPTTHLHCRHPRFLFLDHPDDLRLGEAALSHSSAPLELAQTLHYGEGFCGGQVKRPERQNSSLW